MSSAWKAVLRSLVISSLLSIFLYVCRMVSGESYRYWFLNWNLFLAWLPVLFSYLLIQKIRSGKWLSLRPLLLTVLWLGFLPNSFYLVTDFIHLKSTGEVSLLYDAVMFMTFAWNGQLLGFISVYGVHTELLKRLKSSYVTLLLGALFLLSGFAIYLGRFLAWNTWDILINPVGILADLGERIVHPSHYPTTFSTTALFFLTLSTIYYSLYLLLVSLGRASNTKDL